MSTPEVETGVIAPATKGSRRKRNRSVESLDEAERVRRQLQRQKQGLALKLRAEGKTYKPQKSAKSTKAESASKHGAKAQSPPQQQQQSEPQRPETGSRPEGPVQIIIVPIFWNKKADEKETVISAAEQVLQQLQELGVQAGMDDTNADTPGQKYRYWEQKGVKVRIELGPRDAHKSQACLAISTIPGQVAKKVTYQLGTELTQAVRIALTAFSVAAGSQPGDAVNTKLDNPSNIKQKPKTDQKQSNQHECKPSKQARAGNSSHMPADGTFQKHEDRSCCVVTSAKSEAGKHKLPSGDDLGDEFAVEVEGMDDIGKQKKKKKIVTSSDCAVAASRKGKKNKHKVVSF